MPRVVRAKISTATEMLDTEFARADMILNDRIDGLMEQWSEWDERHVRWVGTTT